MSAINMNFDPVAEERYNSVSRLNRDEIAVLKMLGYGQRSRHWSLLSFGW
jgi:hypothetical protein